MSVATALDRYRDSSVPRLRSTIESAAGLVTSLDRRLAGLPKGATGVVDPETIPVLSKDSLPALQRAEPPLGGLLPPGTPVIRLFASPGPIYEAQLAGPDPWGWEPALRACGIGESDVVLNCFSYHLSPAGAMFDEACVAVGATVVPGGVGMTDAQAQAVADLGVTAYIGLPSYLAALIDRYDQLGLADSSWRVDKALVTAEPLPDDLRSTLTRRVASVLMAYGTAEVGLIGHEVEPGSGLCLNDRVHVQVCDPTTGLATTPGESGEVVASVLRDDYPLVRFGTGDLSCWQLGDDGTLRLAGVLGRVGAAVKVRGMFVHPHQAGEVLAALRRQGAQAGRFVVEQAEGRDRLTLELVAATDDAGALVAEAERQTQQRLRVRPAVRLVDVIAESGEALVDAR